MAASYDIDVMTWNDIYGTTDTAPSVVPDIAGFYRLPAKASSVHPDFQPLDIIFPSLGNAAARVYNVIDVDASIGSGIVDCNGTEFNSTLSPSWNDLGDWLKKVEKFATRPSCSVIPVSGAYLGQIETVDAQLKRVQNLVHKWASSKPSFYNLSFPIIPLTESIADKSKPEALSGLYVIAPEAENRRQIGLLNDFSELYNSFLNALAPVCLVEHRSEPKEVTQFLKSLLRSVRSLRQLLYVASGQVKENFFRSMTRFCGLGWSRRMWFLLHGSHPPKASVLLPA
jgi:hypothetical protein